jgi:hypothetical protein
MRTTFKPGYALALVGLLGLGIGTIAWTGNGQQQQAPYQSKDTVPSERRKATRETDKKYQKDFDKQLDELDKALKEVQNIDMKKIQAEIEASLKNAQVEFQRHQLDMEKFQLELKESLKELNSEKMQKEMQQALKELDKIDVEKMKKELQESLKEINSEKFQQNLQKELQQQLRELDKINVEKQKAEIKRAMEEINADEISRRVEQSLAKVNMEEIKREMEKVKEEMEKNKDHFKVDMEKAREEIKKAKEEIKGYQLMVEEMEKDGLLSTREDYKIQFKNKELFINGKKQSESVTEKYKKYFKKDTTIRKQEGDMNINSHDDKDDDERA